MSAGRTVNKRKGSDVPKKSFKKVEKNKLEVKKPSFKKDDGKLKKVDGKKKSFKPKTDEKKFKKIVEPKEHIEEEKKEEKEDASDKNIDESVEEPPVQISWRTKRPIKPKGKKGKIFSTLENQLLLVDMIGEAEETRLAKKRNRTDLKKVQIAKTADKKRAKNERKQQELEVIKKALSNRNKPSKPSKPAEKETIKEQEIKMSDDKKTVGKRVRFSD